MTVEKLLELYPFLSFIRYPNYDYVGVIQNYDGDIVSMYAFNKLRTEEHKKRFLELAELWWWESNRKIGISIFLKHHWADFRYCLVTLTTKDIKEMRGHCVCLSQLAEKRTKRKVVQLVRKLS